MRTVEVCFRFMYRMSDELTEQDVRLEIEEEGVPTFVDRHEEERWACEVTSIKTLGEEDE